MVIAARNHANLDAAVKELEGMGGKAMAIHMDITKEQDVIDAVAKTHRHVRAASTSWSTTAASVVPPAMSGI